MNIEMNIDARYKRSNEAVSKNTIFQRPVTRIEENEPMVQISLSGGHIDGVDKAVKNKSLKKISNEDLQKNRTSKNKKVSKNNELKKVWKKNIVAKYDANTKKLKIGSYIRPLRKGIPKKLFEFLSNKEPSKDNLYKFNHSSANPRA
jgi:hypothetical protein